MGAFFSSAATTIGKVTGHITHYGEAAAGHLNTVNQFGQTVQAFRTPPPPVRMYGEGESVLGGCELCIPYLLMFVIVCIIILIVYMVKRERMEDAASKIKLPYMDF